MKRIVKFIVLKVVEIAGVCIAYWILSWYGHGICTWLISDYDPYSWGERWLAAPFMGITLGGVLPALICLGLYHWIKWNWEKAGE